MGKVVGIFTGEVWGPYPCRCNITNDLGDSIGFTHRDLADLEYLVADMRKQARENLGDKDRDEA